MQCSHAHKLANACKNDLKPLHVFAAKSSSNSSCHEPEFTVHSTVAEIKLAQFCVMFTIVHFTVVCLVAKPLNRSEAKGDHVMIQTLLLLKCKLICYHAN